MSPTIILDETPQSMFHAAISAALRRQKVQVTNTVVMYMIALLAELVRDAHKRFIVSARGDRFPMPRLAELWQRAMALPPHQRTVVLKQLGDAALLMAGIFHASMNRRLVDVDYCIGMGQSAYNTAGQLLSDDRMFGALYAELSERFVPLVDVLGEVGDGLKIGNATSDLLRLYERWMKTGSPRALQRLVDLGVNVTNDATRTLQ
ncbi:MAG: hypothetical protein AAB932_02340 [Patescibacteria group bacterium]